MKTKIAAVAVAAAVVAGVAYTAAGAGGTVPFKEARLITEINDTDGDAGLQVFLDHEPWKSISIARPDGETVLDVNTRGVLESYGLTELFSESSEPPFTTFPLDEFKKLFPEGNYTFTGTTIDGTQMRSMVKFTHDFPAGPVITSPKEDAELGDSAFTVRWKPGNNPSGVKIKGYEVLVVQEIPGPKRVFSADVPADAQSITVPAQFVQPGIEEYKVEVLAIDTSGNQTLSEIAFSTT